MPKNRVFEPPHSPTPARQPRNVMQSELLGLHVTFWEWPKSGADGTTEHVAYCDLRDPNAEGAPVAIKRCADSRAEAFDAMVTAINALREVLS